MEKLQRIFRYSTDWRAEEAISFVFQGRRYYKGQMVRAHIRGMAPGLYRIGNIPSDEAVVLEVSRRHRMLVYLNRLETMEAEDADTDADSQGRP